MPPGCESPSCEVGQDILSVVAGSTPTISIVTSVAAPNAKQQVNNNESTVNPSILSIQQSGTPLDAPVRMTSPDAPTFYTPGVSAQGLLQPMTDEISMKNRGPNQQPTLEDLVRPHNGGVLKIIPPAPQN
jgi:hypothetical protein